MSNTVNTLRNGAVIAALILFGMSDPAVAADAPRALGIDTRAVESETFGGSAGVAVFRGPLAGPAEGELPGLHDDRITPWEPVEGPEEFTGLVGRYLTPRPPVPAGYLDTVRALGPDPWVRGFTDLW